MFANDWILWLLVIVVLIALSLRMFGKKAGAWVSVGLIAAGAGLWWLNDQPDTIADPPAPPAPRAITSSDCAQCHAHQHKSWQRTYHRTMTRDATPENAKGDFANFVYRYQGLPTRLTREGDSFFMETVDPDWARLRARGDAIATGLAPKFIKLRVDRFVGSHWIQECFHRQANGTFQRLPVLYHIVEKRWVHSNGAFLTPDTNDFWGQCRGTAWNESCLYCHNTGPSKNPVRDARGQIVGFKTETTELGIACAACHGYGHEHIRQHQGLPTSGRQDVVQPEKLSVPRRDEICARCHGAIVPKASTWDPQTHRDPFIPGMELTQFNNYFWSEAEQAVLFGKRRKENVPKSPESNDGRFWEDGTPLTTALEYTGMALSKCYQDGKGTLSCLTCHTMHGDEPNYLLKPKMDTNDACYQCHGDYRGRLAEHTRHPANSPGSLCYNCHMPHQVYSLLTTHRSHRIQLPDLDSSVKSGKPNACILCHLDKSLGWTRNELAKWPGKAKGLTAKLSAEQESIAESILVLARGDARRRVMMAGAFSNPAARQASGTDWHGSLLTRLLENERYPAVRYLGHRAIRVVHGDELAGPFDYLATGPIRGEQLGVLRTRFDAVPVRRPLPYVPLNAMGLPDEAVLDRLRAGRHDPDLSIHE